MCNPNKLQSNNTIQIGRDSWWVGEVVTKAFHNGSDNNNNIISTTPDNKNRYNSTAPSHYTFLLCDNDKAFRRSFTQCLLNATRHTPASNFSKLIHLRLTGIISASMKKEKKKKPANTTSQPIINIPPHVQTPLPIPLCYNTCLNVNKFIHLRFRR